MRYLALITKFICSSALFVGALLGAALFAGALLLAVAPSHAENLLVADLDQRDVSITTDFNGTALLLFGAVNLEDSDDISIVISGPPKSIAIHRKNRVAGIWINTENAELADIPSFYHILSTRPIEEIASVDERHRIKLGYEHIPFTLAQGSSIDEGTIDTWERGLSRNMEANGLWGQMAGQIEIVKGTLFRTNVTLPANVIPGEYQVRVIHFRDGELLAEELSTINVMKTGLSADVYEIAHQYAPLYGIFAILFAVSAGWLAATAFRR